MDCANVFPPLYQYVNDYSQLFTEVVKKFARQTLYSERLLQKHTTLPHQYYNILYTSTS